MAGGFDATGFSTGLIGGINAQDAANAKQQRENIAEGDRAQIDQFQQAAREYDTEKSKASDQSSKIDALANIISKGAPNPAAYSVARDAVEMGYTNSEHLPYVMQAYQDTMKDYMANPDKWGNIKPPDDYQGQTGKSIAVDPGDNPTPNQPNDSNPGQTNALRRSGNQQSIQDLEKVRQGAQGNFQRPYSNLPGGNWSSEMNDIYKGDAGKSAAVTTAEAGAKQNIADSREAKQASDLGLTPPNPEQSSMPSSGMDQPAPNAEGQATGSPEPISPLAIQKSALQPPGQQVASAAQAPQGAAPEDGIHINAAPPPETPLAPQAGPDQSIQAPPSGVNEEYMKQLEAKNPTAAGMIKQIASGELQISPWMLRDRSDGSKSSWYDMIAAAHKYDPSFDMTDYNSRNKMHSSYVGGTDHQNIMRLDTATGHLGTLYMAGKDLDTGNVQAINAAAQKVGAQIGQTPQITYNSIVTRVAPEIVTAYTPTGGSDADRAQSEKAFAAQMSGPQREDTLRATADLLHARMAAVQNAWDTNMGPDKAGKDFFTPNTHAVMKALGVNEADKTPFLTMQDAQSQGQHPLNPNLNTQQKIAPETQSVLSKFGLQ